MKEKVKKRTVAIVGRPNVGKSSIFNRLSCRRIAIVHEERGVTRDRIVQEVEWKGERFDLIDTGGFGTLLHGDNKSQKLSTIEADIQHQIKIALSDASAIIFVADIRAGVVPQDEEVASVLRKSGQPVFLAANKADDPRFDNDSVDFTRLGFPVFPVSALHFRGFAPLMADVISALPEASNPTLTNPLKVTIVGRPNVGKSSFINRLLESERVIVSEMPGTTRDAIDIPFSIGKGNMARHYVLTDTAGIRRQRRIRSLVNRFSISRAEQSIGRADVVLLILDAVDGPTAQDKKIAALILNYRKGYVILANKWDLIKNIQVTQYVKLLQNTLPFLDLASMLVGSAKTGFNMQKVIDTIDSVADHISTQLPTALLNRILKALYQRKNPPLIDGVRLKIYYATQIGIKPIRIVLFINRPESLDRTYAHYLTNSICRIFGLQGAPIFLEVRGKNQVKKYKSSFSLQ